MTKIHIDPSTYSNIKNNTVYNIPSPSSVVLNNHNFFNTTEFNIENNILKAKILNIDKKNILHVVFSCNNNNTYNLWKCKLNIDNDKINNKIIKAIINPIINTNIKIKSYKFIKNQILLIDIYTNYNNPLDNTFLSSKIVETHNNIINNIKEKSIFYKLINLFGKTIDNIGDFISSKYGDYVIDTFSEEYLNNLINK